MQFIKRLLDRSRSFGIFDFAMFKAVLLSAGILVGAYLSSLIMPFIWIAWTIFAVSFVYMFLVMFFFKRGTN